MDCNKANELISLAVDEMLSTQEEQMLQEHLDTCESCREDYELYMSIQSTLQLEEAASLPENFHSDLMQRVASIEKDNVVQLRKPFHQRFNYKQFNAAAVIVVVLIFGLIGLNNLDQYIGTNNTEMTESMAPTGSKTSDAKMETKSVMKADEAMEVADDSVSTRNVDSRMADKSSDQSFKEEMTEETATVTVDSGEQVENRSAQTETEAVPPSVMVVNEAPKVADAFVEEGAVQEAATSENEVGSDAQVAMVAEGPTTQDVVVSEESEASQEPQVKMARDESSKDMVLTTSEEPVAYGESETKPIGLSLPLMITFALAGLGIMAGGVLLVLNRSKK